MNTDKSTDKRGFSAANRQGASPEFSQERKSNFASGFSPCLRVSVVKTVLLALMSVSSVAGQTSPAAPRSLAAQCGKGLEQAPKRIFSSAGARGWEERTGAKPQHHDAVSMGGQTFEVFSSPTGRHFVRVVNYNTGSATFQTNCFNEAGKLQSMHYEMRTGQGWGYEDIQEFDAQGKRLSHATRFFDTTEHKEMKRPPEAESFPDFTKPVVYRSFDSLPFIPAFKRANATQK